MILRGLLLAHMARLQFEAHQSDDRYFALLEQASALFLKAADARGIIRTALCGRDGFIKIQGLIAGQKARPCRQEALTETMSVLADRIAIAPLTKSHRNDFFQLINITGDWEMARRIVDQWKRVDPMNRDAPQLGHPGRHAPEEPRACT